MKLTLKEIVMHLKALEEAIIFKLIARAQYPHNPRVYELGKSDFRGMDDKSLFDVMLLEKEKKDARFGRFTVPEERPFNDNLPKVERVVEGKDSEIDLTNFNKVNLCKEIKKAYLSLIPKICRPGDDYHNQDSSAEEDVNAIRVIAKRIHYGAMYVAERKFQDEPEAYSKMIAAKDENALITKLTRKEVEDKILERVYKKDENYQKGVRLDIRHTIDPKIIADFYRECIIPLTKKGEIMYLMQRGC